MDISAIQDRTQQLFPGLLGIRFLEATPERVKAELTVREDLCTVPGVMHGAALYRAFAANEPGPAAREALLRAAEKEEENAQTLEGPA